MARTPAALQPGIGLRPGGERPGLEAQLLPLFAELFDDIVERSDSGQHTVVDVGLHDSYRTDLSLWPTVVRRLYGRPVMIVGVRCPLPEILRRRALSTGSYLEAATDGTVPDPIIRWQEEVHKPGIYDLEVDTGSSSAALCATRILRHFGFATSQSRESAERSESAVLDALERLAVHYDLTMP